MEPRAAGLLRLRDQPIGPRLVAVPRNQHPLYLPSPVFQGRWVSPPSCHPLHPVPAPRVPQPRRRALGPGAGIPPQSAAAWRGSGGGASELQPQRQQRFSSRSSIPFPGQGCFRNPALRSSQPLPTAPATSPAAASLALLDHCPDLTLGFLGDMGDGRVSIYPAPQVTQPLFS